MTISFGLSNNNKWQWWMWFTGCPYRRACGSSQLVWCKGRRPRGVVLYSSREPSELSQWLCYDDSTTNIVLVIIVVLITTSIVNVACSVGRRHKDLMVVDKTARQQYSSQPSRTHIHIHSSHRLYNDQLL